MKRSARLCLVRRQAAIASWVSLIKATDVRLFGSCTAKIWPLLQIRLVTSVLDNVHLAHLN
jgi:hypothetical protein